MRVLNFGSLNIDHIYHVDHIVAPGETTAAGGLDYAAGGKGLNQSIALARTGIATYHAGCVGKDGQPLLDLLRANQVRTEHLLPVEQVNGHAIIQVGRTGQNSIIIHGGSNGSITREQVDATLAQFTSDAVVLLQNEISQVDYIARRCRDLGIPLVFNPSPISPQLLSSFPFETVTLLLINETEGQAISGREAPEEILDALLARYPGMRIVLTLGGEGVCCGEGSQRIHQDAFHVSAVDTTGAGDTFTGFFLGLLLQDYPVEKALRYACAAAALAVTVHGAAPSIPSMEAVERMVGGAAVPAV